MEKQNNELQFWRQLYTSHSNYPAFRRTDGDEKMKYFIDIKNRDGLGLDVGSGLISVFEGLNNKIIAVDPLMDEYGVIYSVDSDIEYKKMDGEELDFPEGHFDYAFCVNVIDHTPNPQKMADEIKRVVKKGGKIYFEVNFDDSLTDCHYALWNKEKVDEVFGDLKLEFEKLERNQRDSQSLYHAIYENISANANI